MLQITNTKDEIIVREIPFSEWIIAALSGLVFIVVVCAALFSKADLKDWIGISFLLAPLGALLLYLLTKPTITVKINNPGKTISVRRQHLFKYSFDVYSFDEIADFIYIDAQLVGEEGRESAVYQLILPLKTGESIALSRSGGSKDNEYHNAIDLMNPYIFDTSNQIPFKLTVFNED